MHKSQLWPISHFPCVLKWTRHSKSVKFFNHFCPFHKSACHASFNPCTDPKQNKPKCMQSITIRQFLYRSLFTQSLSHTHTHAEVMDKGKEALVVCSDKSMGIGITIWDLDTGDHLLHIPTCASPSHGLLCLRNQFLVASQIHKHGSVGGGAIFTWALNKVMIIDQLKQSSSKWIKLIKWVSIFFFKMVIFFFFFIFFSNLIILSLLMGITNFQSVSSKDRY